MMAKWFKLNILKMIVNLNYSKWASLKDDNNRFNIIESIRFERFKSE